MFNLPDDRTPLRIAGIDPGSNTLGVSIIDVEIDAPHRATIIDARTFVGAQMLGPYRELAEVYGDRFARLRALEFSLLDYFHEMMPHSIISESPYMSRFAATYAALTECMTSIRRAVAGYNSRLPLITIDPASVKVGVKVSGKSGDKELMRQAVLGLTDPSHPANAHGLRLENPYQLPLHLLDEHSIDSLAVAFSRVQVVRGLL